MEISLSIGHDVSCLLSVHLTVCGHETKREEETPVRRVVYSLIGVPFFLSTILEKKVWWVESE